MAMRIARKFKKSKNRTGALLTLITAALLCNCRAEKPKKSEDPAETDGEATESEVGSFTNFRASGEQPTPRAGATGVWSGNRLFIFGGETKEYGFIAEGRIYNPTSGRWSAITSSSQPAPRRDHTAVAMNSGTMVWGGLVYATPDATTPTDDGAFLENLTKDWKQTPKDKAPAARSNHTAVALDSDVYIWGGIDASGTPLSTGAVYTSKNTWIPMTATSAPSGRHGHTAVASTDAILIWGGKDASGSLGDGKMYDIKTKKWTAMTDDGAPSPRFGHSGVWVDGKMVIWGGASQKDGKYTFYSDGAAFDPKTNTWSAVSDKNIPAERQKHTAVVAKDRYMIVYGGQNSELQADGGICDAREDVWYEITPPSDAVGRSKHVAVWSGEAMLVFGGYSSDDEYLGDGFYYFMPKFDE